MDLSNLREFETDLKTALTEARRRQRSGEQLTLEQLRLLALDNSRAATERQREWITEFLGSELTEAEVNAARYTGKKAARVRHDVGGAAEIRERIMDFITARSARLKRKGHSQRTQARIIANDPEFRELVNYFNDIPGQTPPKYEAPYVKQMIRAAEKNRKKPV